MVFSAVDAAMDHRENGVSEDIGDVQACGQTEKVYMDYNATTPHAPSVVVEISKALTALWANPSSKSAGGMQANKAISKARGRIGSMVNASDPSEIIFMSGGTEANNYVIWNSIKYFKKFMTEGTFNLGKPHIISSVIEHDSVLRVLKNLELEGIIDLTLVKVSPRLGFVDPDEVVAATRDETVLMTIMLANNETGIIQPISEICRKFKEIEQHRPPHLPKIFLHTDAAQGIGKISVDVEKLGVDYLTIVGHKFYGPRIGALWSRSKCPTYTMLHGGAQESGKRAGTENTCMIIGLGEAAQLVVDNIHQYTDHFTALSKYFREKLIETFGNKVKFNAPFENVLPNTLSVSFSGPHLHGRRVLDHCKVLEASVGAACHSHLGDKPSHILLAHGIAFETARNTIRISIGRETSKGDVNLVVSDLKMSIESLES